MLGNHDDESCPPHAQTSREIPRRIICKINLQAFCTTAEARRSVPSLFAWQHFKNEHFGQIFRSLSWHSLVWLRILNLRPRVKWLEHWLIDHRSRWLHLMTLLGLTLTQDSEFQPVPVITGPRSKIGLIDNQREGWYNVKPDRRSL